MMSVYLIFIDLLLKILIVECLYPLTIFYLSITIDLIDFTDKVQSSFALLYIYIWVYEINIITFCSYAYVGI